VIFMKFIDERLNNARNYLIAGKTRFYIVNLYKPLERIKNKDLNIKLWDKIQDKRKLGAWYQKMKKAKEKQGDIYFAPEWVKRESFIKAEKAFGELLNSRATFDISLIDSILIPFIKECEFEEIRFDMGALK